MDSKEKPNAQLSVSINDNEIPTDLTREEIPYGRYIAATLRLLDAKPIQKPTARELLHLCGGSMTKANNAMTHCWGYVNRKLQQRTLASELPEPLIQAMLSAMKIAKDSTDEKIVKLETEHSQKINELTAKITEHNAYIAHVDRERKELENTNSRLTTQLDKQSVQVSELERLINQKQNLIDDKQLIIMNQEHVVGKLSKELNDYKSECRENYNEIGILKNDLKHLKVDSLRDQQALSDKNNELKEISDKTHALDKALSEKKQQLSHKIEKIRSLQETLDKRDKDLSVYRAQTTQALANLERERKSSLDLAEENMSLFIKCSKLGNQLDINQQINKNLELKLIDAKEHILELESEINRQNNDESSAEIQK